MPGAATVRRCCPSPSRAPGPSSSDRPRATRRRRTALRRGRDGIQRAARRARPSRDSAPLTRCAWRIRRDSLGPISGGCPDRHPVGPDAAAVLVGPEVAGGLVTRPRVEAVSSAMHIPAGRPNRLRSSGRRAARAHRPRPGPASAAVRPCGRPAARPRGWRPARCASAPPARRGSAARPAARAGRGPSFLDDGRRHVEGPPQRHRLGDLDRHLGREARVAALAG